MAWVHCSEPCCQMVVWIAWKWLEIVLTLLGQSVPKEQLVCYQLSHPATCGPYNMFVLFLLLLFSIFR